MGKNEFSIGSSMTRIVTKDELHKIIDETFPEEYCGNIATITAVGVYGNEEYQSIVFGRKLKI